MKQNREYRNYLNYFQKWEGMGSLGACLMAVGLLLLWLGNSFISYVLMAVLLPVGLGIFLYGSIGRATEADFRNEIDKQLERIEFRELEENPRFRRRLGKEAQQRELAFSGYLFDEGGLIKRQKNAALCSSRYVCAKMRRLTDAFYIKSTVFSFVSDEREEAIYEIPFAEIADITVRRETKIMISGKVQYTVKTCMLCWVYDGGKELLLPITDDIYAEELAERVKRSMTADWTGF